MSSLPDKKPEFAITIEGTTFTSYADEETGRLKIKVEGTDAAKRGKSALNLICDKLRRDLNYSTAVRHASSISSELESELTLTFIGESTPVPPQNAAYEVHGYLSDLKKFADTVGPMTGEPIGFDFALLDMRRPLVSITLTHAPGKSKKEYLVKKCVGLEDLRAAIIHGVNESGVYAHLSNGASDINPISGAIIDTLYAAQEAKINPESKWGTTIPLTDKEIAKAIDAGIETGLQLVKAPEEHDKDMAVDLRREIFKALRSMDRER